MKKLETASIFFPFFKFFFSNSVAQSLRELFTRIKSARQLQMLFIVPMFSFRVRGKFKIKCQRMNQPKKLLVTIDSFFPLGSSVEKMSLNLQSSTYQTQPMMEKNSVKAVCAISSHDRKLIIVYQEHNRDRQSTQLSASLQCKTVHLTAAAV